jgi:acyl-coenzyme A synthetase/AMP-(fatty) acid ligase
LLDSFARRRDVPCLIHRDRIHSFGELESRRRAWLDELEAKSLPAGAVVGLESDFSLDAVALLLALLARCNVAALLPRGGDPASMLRDARAAAWFRARSDGAWDFERCADPESHPLLDELHRDGHGGFVIFSSGSSGHPKAVLHDAERFLVKFERPGKALRTLAFLLFDHIAGLDTLFYTLSASGSLVLPEARDPGYVCGLIERFDVQVLPASPSFFRLLLLSGALDTHSLPSLEVITYGSEPMDEATLKRIAAALPTVRIAQKYGTSELGSPRSRSRERDSLWLALKEDDTEAKVVDGVLWLRSPGMMLGYLNAPSTVDSEGWYCTGDQVEQHGDWIRFLGRESDAISVGGEKVLPHEVESVILELDWVEDAMVTGEAHALLGQAVVARVLLKDPAQVPDYRHLIRQHCLARLPRYKAPVKVILTTGSLATSRQKKLRR